MFTMPRHTARKEAEMVQIDVPVAFAVGSFCADMARRQLRFGRAEYYYRTFLLTMLFLIFFFSWIPVYFLLNYFGWETTYMWWHADSVTAYPGFLPAFMLLFFGMGALGFLLGHRLVVSGRELANRLVWIGVLVFSAIWIFAQPHRTFRVGAYSEWAAGKAPLFYEDGVFLFMLIFVLVVWAAGLVWTALVLRRDGRHLDALAEPRAAGALDSRPAPGSP
jgi:hypothetical protein